MESGPLDYDDV